MNPNVGGNKSPKVKPKKPKETKTETQILEGKAVGTYQDPDDNKSYMVLCKEGHPTSSRVRLPLSSVPKNGAPKAVEFWLYGRPHSPRGESQREGEWSVKNGEIHIIIPGEGIGICLLNSNGDLQLIALEKDGKREKADDLVFKKVK